MRRSVRRGGVAFLAAAPVAIWLSAWSVEEARFSPFTLEYQKRRSLVVFTGEVPIYRSDWEPASNEVLNYLTEKKFIQPIASDDSQWNLVHRFKEGHHGGWMRPYRCLHPKLVGWSEAHPDVARLFWQTGYNLVRSNNEREVDAGYELLGSLWEQCETPSDLRLVIAILEDVYRINILSKAPAALGSVKIVPSKSAMLAPDITPKNMLDQFKKFQKRNDAKSKLGPPAPPPASAPPPVT